ncbi:hypothetical protein K0U73_11020 [bacterium]|jgi:hypothetical protein|nr:hypothetical protein [Acidimicrobiaceae bacterium]MCH9804312.1 hypothetical protein [bacterium]MDC1390590.1 hypothetical protein [Acidimicrobiales bacterium]HAY68766.1 hypothetical protein [Acidimicrobiaceae bacterium]|tara:strand:+ start:233 stop:718 length:486 start_codon:yes stop_codon:yes gene_type:complete
MDFSKLSQSNMIAGGGGIVAFIASILPWYSFDFGFDLPGVDTSVNAWSAGFAAWFGCLLALAAGVLIALKAMGMFEAKVLGMETEQVAMVLAGLGFVLVVLRWLTETSNTAIGLYLGLIATAATAAGAFLSGKDSGIGIPTADDFKGSGGDDAASGGTSTF